MLLKRMTEAEVKWAGEPCRRHADQQLLQLEWQAQALQLVHHSPHSHCVMPGSAGLGGSSRAGSMVQTHGVHLQALAAFASFGCDCDVGQVHCMHARLPTADTFMRLCTALIRILNRRGRRGHHLLCRPRLGHPSSGAAEPSRLRR